MIKKIKKQMFSYWVDTDKKAIIKITARSLKADGAVIDLSKEKFLDEMRSIEGNGRSVMDQSGKVHIDTLILPQGIQEISSFAFEKSDIRCVVWPTACQIIPYAVFYQSQLKEIKNIDNVKEIKSSAFSCSQIETFNIPQGVSVIPPGCFYKTPLTKVSGIQRILEIGENAFAYCKNVKCVDLSTSLCHWIGPNAFQESGIRSFKPGYYLLNSDSSGYYLQNVDPTAFHHTFLSTVKMRYAAVEADT